MDYKVFEDVIKEGDYFNFFLGKGEYFILDREYGEHWVYGIFKEVLWPYAEKYGDCRYETEFWRGIMNLLQGTDYKDENLILDAIVNNLFVFYEFANPSVNSRRILSTPKHFSTAFKNLFIKNKISLIQDKRSVGVDWNSANGGDGLWGGVLYNLKLMEDKGGPTVYSEILNDI